MPEEPDEDDGPAGLPPDPLDRVWFHPSEVGAAITAWRSGGTPKRRDLGVVLLGSLLSVGVMVGVLAAAGVFSTGSHSSTRQIIPLPAAPSGGFAGLVSGAAPSIVSVNATSATGTTRGSGVAVASNRVLTSATLVGLASSITVDSLGGRQLTARVLGADAETDLTLLAVDDGDFPAARLGVNDALRVGDSVVALGLGASQDPAAYEGIVSRLNIVSPVPAGDMTPGFIETDAHMGPDVPGGALIGSDGSVVGILSAALPTEAVPIAIADDVFMQIQSSGQVHHAWVGVWTIDAADHPGGGAQVTVVAPNGPAAQAGVAPGDIVTAVTSGIQTEDVHSAADLVAAVAQTTAGDPATLHIVRGNGRTDRQLSLGDRGPVGASIAGLAA
ncbi:MAG TPA: trypsin-like peptidase domain-containing protein [Acidimicrobiia bacterium]|nr:trypsin-like peptidase domain-containing protein [Acidimicrobiia bacterium]